MTSQDYRSRNEPARITAMWDGRGVPVSREHWDPSVRKARTGDRFAWRYGADERAEDDGAE